MSDINKSAHSVCEHSRQPTLLEFPSSYSCPFWYATYTCSRREKQVARLLQERGVECFLPLYEAVRRNPSGRKRVHFLPLFPGYVFVHMALRDHLRVLQVPGVVRLVSFHSQPAALNDSEIEALRNALTLGLPAEPFPYLKAGHDVEILSGPLQGLRGRVLRKNSHFRVILSVDLLRRSIVVDVDGSDLTTRALPSAA